jgi:hypothetical protein
LCEIGTCAHAATFARATAMIEDARGIWWGSLQRSFSMNYRALALTIATMSFAHVTAADAGSIYVAPGGVYIGGGPVYVIPNGHGNGVVDPTIGLGAGIGLGAAIAEPTVVAPGIGIEPTYYGGYGYNGYYNGGYGYGYGNGYYNGGYGHGYGNGYYNGGYGHGYGNGYYNGGYYNGGGYEEPAAVLSAYGRARPIEPPTTAHGRARVQPVQLPPRPPAAIPTRRGGECIATRGLLGRMYCN